MKKPWWVVLLLITPGFGFVLLLIGAVVSMAVAQSIGFYNFAGESQFSLEHWQQIISGDGSRRFWRAFRYSAYIASYSAILSVIIAYPIALWLRKPFKGSITLSAILKAPMLVHGLVAAFLMINVISYHGFINEFMIWSGLWDKPVRMQNDKLGIGVIFLQVWKQMPFALLLLSGSVQNLSDSVLDAAQDLGAGSIARFRKVVLPLTLQSLQAALILIFIGAAGDFSFQKVAGPTAENSMATLMIYVQTDVGDWNGAAVIAIMLMVLALFGSLAVAIVAKYVSRVATL